MKNKKKGITINLTPYMGKGIQLPDNKEFKDRDDKIKEQKKYGIYFDDEYDYLQHLKPSNEYDPELLDIIHVDADKFYLEKVLNEKRDKLYSELDQEVINALENEEINDDLEDDFVVRASANVKTLLDDDFNKDFETFYENYDDLEIGSLGVEDLKSQYLPPLQLSNITNRSKKLDNIEIQIDSPHFQKYLYVNSDDISTMSSESEENQNFSYVKPTHLSHEINPYLIVDPFKINRHKTYQQHDISGDLCESMTCLKVKQQQNCDDNQSLASKVSTCILKDKTENKERKKIIKEERKLRREEKKTHQLLFKQEICKENMQKIKSRLNHQAAIKLS